MTPDLPDAVAKHEIPFLDLLAELVGIDSGSHDHDGVMRMATRVADECRGDGREVVLHQVGPLELVEVIRPGTGPKILLNAHLDTVFEPGVAVERPFQVVDGIAKGPGVCDDKAGIVTAITAMRVLDDLDVDAHVVAVFTPDEEIGWPHSQSVLPDIARECDVALCLEGARADGSLVSARKGGADLRIKITGRAAHSGVEPEKGVHAALQMAHTIIGLQALNDPATGVTVNAGMVRSGTRPNIVPPSAEIHCDLRAWQNDDFLDAIDRAIAVAREIHVEGVTVDVELDHATGPMEATPASIALADLATTIAADLGFAVRHVATGGIGDANTIALAGVPVLDGLAPIGGDDHSPDEWLDVSSIVPRVSLLVGLIANLAANGVPTGADV